MVNRQILLGRLGGQAELRHTSGGATVCNFSVCTNEVWTDKAGQKQERATWHRVVWWGKVAEALQPRLQKGVIVYVEGPTQHRQFQDKDGATKYSTEIRADRVQLCGNTTTRHIGTGGSGDQEPQDAGFGEGEPQEHLPF